MITDSETVITLFCIKNIEVPTVYACSSVLRHCCTFGSCFNQFLLMWLPYTKMSVPAGLPRSVAPDSRGVRKHAVSAHKHHVMRSDVFATAAMFVVQNVKVG